MLQIIIQGRAARARRRPAACWRWRSSPRGAQVQSFASYGGARRGTPVSSFIRVDDRPIRVRCDIEQADAILCFDASLLEGRLLAAARPDTLIVVNSSRTPERVRREAAGLPGDSGRRHRDFAPPRPRTDRQFRAAGRARAGDRGAETRGADPHAHRRRRRSCTTRTSRPARRATAAVDAQLQQARRHERERCRFRASGPPAPPRCSRPARGAPRCRSTSTPRRRATPPAR